MTHTVLFIHGAWLTPASWPPFSDAFAERGLTCHAPAWPYLDRPVDELKRAPDPKLAQLGIGDLVDHYAAIVRGLPEPPVIVGHSFGGLITQLLLDRGLGAAGVAVDPAPPRGVLARPRAVITSFAVFRTWMGWKKIHTMSEAAFAKGFANEMTPEEQRDAYRTQVVPAPGRIFFQAAFGVGTKVRFDNPQRPPLLLIAGDRDRTVPIAMVRDTFTKQRRSPSPTELQEFPGRCHFLLRQQGWQEIAQAILAWLEKTAVLSAPAA